MTDRVVVHYRNLVAWAARRFVPAADHPSDGYIDPVRLAHTVIARRRRPSMLTGVRIYRGLPDHARQPRGAEDSERQPCYGRRTNWSRSINDRCSIRLTGPPGPQSRRAWMSQIAVDVVHMALQARYDAAIIASSDSDLLPAIEFVISRRLAHVELAAWEGAPRPRFPGTATPWCHLLTASDFTTLKYPVDSPNE